MALLIGFGMFTLMLTWKQGRRLLSDKLREEIRHLEDVAAMATDQGFAAPQIVEMPANNLSLIFRRRARIAT